MSSIFVGGEERAVGEWSAYVANLRESRWKRTGGNEDVEKPYKDHVSWSDTVDYLVLKGEKVGGNIPKNIFRKLLEKCDNPTAAELIKRLENETDPEIIYDIVSDLRGIWLPATEEFEIPEPPHIKYPHKKDIERDASKIIELEKQCINISTSIEQYRGLIAEYLEKSYL